MVQHNNKLQLIYFSDLKYLLIYMIRSVLNDLKNNLNRKNNHDKKNIKFLFSVQILSKCYCIEILIHLHFMKLYLFITH